MNTFAAYRALLVAQGKQQRLDLWCIATLSAMVAPFGLSSVYYHSAITIYELRNVASLIGATGAVLACIAGALFAWRAYALDSATRHTYAQSLPIPRAQYALLRAATGVSLLLIPAVAFLIGALLAANAFPLPDALQAYPVGLAVRFLLAAVFAFSLAFALQYGFGRQATRVAVAAFVLFAVAELVAQMFFAQSVAEQVWRLLASTWSPFRVFANDWMLFDV